MLQKLKTPVLSLLAFSLTALVACAPSTPTTPGNPAQAKLNAVAVSKISADNAVSSNISLSWEALPNNVRSLKFFRRKASQSLNDAQEIATLPTLNKQTLDDSDPSLEAGVEYVYAMRGDNENNIAVASAETQPISIINAQAIKTFKITEPSSNGATLKDPLGQGHQFSWEDAGTGLYYVKVTDTAGQVLWGAITKETSISYGTRSGSTKQGGITSPPDPKLEVPLALTPELVISSTTPNPARNEVILKGIGNTAQFRIEVSAIETQPEKGNLAAARSIAIRKAQEVRFIAQ